MANKEQLAILDRGVDAWNEWREEDPAVRADLSEANLSGRKLCDIDLRRAILTAANLSNSDLSNADLREAKLGRANLTGANLTATDLRRAFLRSAVLINANLRGSDLGGARLERADLRDAKLKGAYLADRPDPADLTGALFSEATTWPEAIDPVRMGAKLSSGELPEPLPLANEPASTFTITFASTLSKRQIAVTLQALADYYRACGGVGFMLDLELEEVLSRENLRV